MDLALFRYPLPCQTVNYKLLRPKREVTKLNRDQRKAKNLETPVGFSLSRWENLESVLKQELLQIESDQQLQHI
jgi:hypothetical protein